MSTFQRPPKKAPDTRKMKNFNDRTRIIEEKALEMQAKRKE